MKLLVKTAIISRLLSSELSGKLEILGSVLIRDSSLSPNCHVPCLLFTGKARGVTAVSGIHC